MSEPTLIESLRRPGLYGKLHSHGDFIARRLPQNFISGWDAWLQEGIAVSKNVLGPAWEDKYREAPVWRFVLPPGVCGTRAWAGIVQPSVDRVGRYFPLTIAAALPGPLDALGTLFGAAPWYAEIEREGSVAFDATASLDDLDARLETLVFPADSIAVAIEEDDDTKPMAERIFTAAKVDLGGNISRDGAKAALNSEQIVIGRWDCVWISMDSAVAEPVLLVSKALPEPRCFCALLDGHWAEHGWEAGVSGAIPSH
ncbi:MAG TPA: type VI secretion system-associated protein TagF [Burkholderiales bacterium]|nr:type VI secretion system-associated protein TagF [Burkholderiales bacterium]